MSLKTMLWAIEQYNLSPTEKIVLIDLAERAGENGQCWPTVQLIARRCNISTRTAVSVLHKLEAYGLLTIKQSAGHRANRYQLHTDRKMNHAEIAGFEPSDPEIHDTNPEIHDAEPCNPQHHTLKSAAIAPYTTEPPNRTSNRTSKGNHAHARESEQPFDADAEFDRWWDIYPKHENRVDARKAWDEAIATIAPDDLLAATAAHAFDPETKFIPQPANWLRKRRWQDERPGNGIDPVLAAAGLSRADFDHGAPR